MRFPIGIDLIHQCGISNLINWISYGSEIMQYFRRCCGFCMQTFRFLLTDASVTIFGCFQLDVSILNPFSMNRWIIGFFNFITTVYNCHSSAVFLLPNESQFLLYIHVLLLWNSNNFRNFTCTLHPQKEKKEDGETE